MDIVSISNYYSDSYGLTKNGLPMACITSAIKVQVQQGKELVRMLQQTRQIQWPNYVGVLVDIIA